MRQSALFPIGYPKDALRVSVGLALRIRAVLGCVGIQKGPIAGALANQMVLSVGFEPATFRSGGERSIQLS